MKKILVLVPIMVLAMATLSLVLVPLTAYAEDGVPNTWESIGPEGGVVITLAIDPQTTSTLYAGTGWGVYKSTDGGLSWTVSSGGLTGSISALAINPQDPLTLYAGTGSGVYKSTDGGANWVASSGGLTSSISTLAIDSQTPTTLYAGSRYVGVFKSTDGGENWVESNTGLNSLSVSALVVDPQTPTTIYAGTFSSWGTHKSTNGGASWTVTDISVGANPSFRNTYVTCLVINPQDTSILYLGTQGSGVWYTVDGGDNWYHLSSTTKTNDLGIYSNISALAIDHSAQKTVYAADYRGVFKSTLLPGNFIEWHEINNGLTGRINALSIDSADTSTLYAGGFGVFKTTDGGVSWNLSLTGLRAYLPSALAVDPQTATTLYIGTDIGMFKSIDSGLTWIRLSDGPGDVRAIAIDYQNPSTIYAGSFSSGFFKSTDGGVTWIHPQNFLLQLRVLVIDPQTPTTIYSEAGGVAKSTDAGVTWTRSSFIGLVYSLAIDPQTPTTLYAGTHNNGILRSTNGGESWSVVNDTARVIKGLAIDPITPATLYAGNFDDGILKSTDAGGDWTTSSTGLPSTPVGTIVVDPTEPSNVYVATHDAFGLSGQGVFRSNNSGTTWTALNDGLTNFNVTALALDPQNPTTLYASVPGDILKMATPPVNVPPCAELRDWGPGPGGKYFYDTDTGLYWWDPAEFVDWSYSDINAFVTASPIWKWASSDEINALVGKSSEGGVPLTEVMGPHQFQTGCLVDRTWYYGSRWIGYFENSPDQPDGWLVQTVLDCGTTLVVNDLSTLGDSGFQGGVDNWTHGAWINSTVPPCENTPEGTQVSVQPVDPGTGTHPVTVTFNEVTKAGMTSLTTSSSGPEPPSGLQPGNPPVYYDITTTAEFSGPIEVCIDYSGISFVDESALKLYHYENGEPVDVTYSLAPENDTICGIIYSFSPSVILEPSEVLVEIDIKPGSCPNPLNLKCLKCRKVLPVAVLGTEELDVTTIDPATIQLSREGIEEGVAPIRWSYEDVATPFEGELCDCHDLNGDGYLDLTLKFRVTALVETLELGGLAGETIPLTLTGNLKEEEGGMPIVGEDCVWGLGDVLD